ncbi:MAG: hypothetical protein JWM91_4491 [Rhodospirillales bacterium]|nr:hypothetical protein [Rhodospirillales bacterium]
MSGFIRDCIETRLEYAELTDRMEHGSERMGINGRDVSHVEVVRARQIIEDLDQVIAAHCT